MSKILDYLRLLLTIIVGVSFFFFSAATSTSFIFILYWILAIFWVGTSIIDAIRKNHFTKRHNIISIIILLILLLIIYKPFIDTIIFTPFGSMHILNNVAILFGENMICITISIICLFLLNYVDYKLK